MSGLKSVAIIVSGVLWLGRALRLRPVATRESNITQLSPKTTPMVAR